MKAVWLEGGAVSLVERPEPQPGPGEALLRVLRAGICSTDLQLQAGYMGFAGVPGHEFVAVIERCPGAPEREGQRVVGEINAVPPGCDCEACGRGLPSHCARRSVLGILGRDGAFAERCCLPLANCLPVPEAIGDDRAVFTEPVAAAYQITEQLPVEGRRALVLGAGGKLGSLCARVLAARGARVDVLGRREAALAPLLSDGFARAEGEPAPRYELVVEATSDPAMLAEALRWTRPRGAVVIKTTAARSAELDLSLAVINELTLVGSRCGPFAPALAALAASDLAPERTIGARFPLAQAEAAFAAAADPADPARRKVILEIADV